MKVPEYPLLNHHRPHWLRNQHRSTARLNGGGPKLIEREKKFNYHENIIRDNYVKFISTSADENFPLSFFPEPPRPFLESDYFSSSSEDYETLKLQRKKRFSFVLIESSQRRRLLNHGKRFVCRSVDVSVNWMSSMRI